jgi:kynurenine formamidase
MTDARPNTVGHPITVHRALPAFGLPLVDNAALGELAKACEERDRWEFLLVIAPLRLVGSTGSPVNPIALI